MQPNLATCPSHSVVLDEASFMPGYEPEIRRLMDMLPASGRMCTKLVSQPTQRQVISTPFPLPWMSDRPVSINFDQLNQLTIEEQDLLVLRTVCWSLGIQWFQPKWYQGMVVVSAVGIAIEAVQADPVGVIVAGALGAIAGTQIWRDNRSTQRELDADTSALAVAQRRGYTEAAAARFLLSAIEKVAQIEQRSGLTFVELLRCQNLRTIAGTSALNNPPDRP